MKLEITGNGYRLFNVTADGMKNDALDAGEALLVVATAIIKDQVHHYLNKIDGPAPKTRRRFEVGDKVKWGETNGQVQTADEEYASLIFEGNPGRSSWSFRQDNGKFSSFGGIGPAAEVIP